MDFGSITSPRRVNLLISFMDIQGFRSISGTTGDLLQLFDLLNGWATIIVKHVDQAGGRVMKFIGDSCLIIFPEDEADRGVRAMLTVKQEVEAYFKSKGFPNKVRTTAHVGEAVLGQFGAGSCKQLDVFGDSVNTAASLERADRAGRLTISAQAFRRLSPTTRKFFHKYTPPVVYLAEH
jgi:adenylate cyclase